MNGMFLNIISIVFITIFNVFTLTVNKNNRVTEEQMNKILNDAFSENKTDYIRSKNNILRIFNRSKRIFEIVSEGTSIENDFSVNFNKNVFVKYFDEKDLLNESTFIESNQLFYDKKNNIIIFYGNVHVDFIVNHSELYTECIVYDLSSETFFNTHKCKIKLNNVELEGDNLYIKKDMSLFLLDNIKMSNFKF